ncbi:MAG TPA: leucyl aminopeptidase [Tepidisphaeraceae bacterium]|jgi:leucyl aminopeptidase
MIPTSTRATLQVAKSIPTGSEAIAIFVHKQTKPGADYPSLPDAERKALDSLISSGVVRGKSNEVTQQLLDGPKPRRLLVAGLGDAAKFSAECLREAGAAVAKAARKHRIKSIAVVPPPIPVTLPPLPGAPATEDGIDLGITAMSEGLLVGSFEFEEYRGAGKNTGDAERAGPVAITLVAENERDIRPAVERGRIIADAQNFARTIASRPGNNINPPSLAKVAQDLAREVGLGVRVLDEKEMKRLGMGGILGVGSGSVNTPPRMIVLEYNGAGGGKSGSKTRGRSSTANRKSQAANDQPLLVVGKSITFDSGGISIKPADRMGRMIYDKSGGMAVLGLMYALAKLKLPIRVVGILASAENILSESSYRPGDILRMYNGVTVEVTNTDAEGRLVLGDALAWGIEQYNPSAVVDLATLTGGVVIALGKAMAGLMSNDDALVQELTEASRVAGEKVWRLPIWDEHRDLMKGHDAADIVNSGPGRDASPLQGGAFLTWFVKWEGEDRIPWAHLDIAGVADTEKELPLYPRGSTGWGVRTLVEWVSKRAGEK